jgi:hypothetical protein
MLGGLAMVLGSMLMMFGRGVVMLDDLFFGHDDLLEGGAALPARPARRTGTLGGRCCSAVTARCQCWWIADGFQPMTGKRHIRLGPLSPA